MHDTKKEPPKQITRRQFIRQAGSMLASATPLGIALPEPSLAEGLEAPVALPSSVSSLIYRWLSYYYGAIIDGASEHAALLKRLQAMQVLPSDVDLNELAYEIANATPYTAESTASLTDLGKNIASTPISEAQIRRFLTEYKTQHGDFLYGFLTGNRGEQEILRLFAHDTTCGADRIRKVLDQKLEDRRTVCQQIKIETDRFPPLRDAVNAILDDRKKKTSEIPSFSMRYRCNSFPIPTDYYQDTTTNSWRERLVDDARISSQRR